MTPGPSAPSPPGSKPSPGFPGLHAMQKLLCDIFFLVTHPQQSRQDAQHHLDDVPSHGLEEEEGRDSAGLGGREEAAGTVGTGDTRTWECE